MIKSKNILVKTVSYIVFGLLSLLLILTFGMPSFLDRMGLNRSVVAIVNGKSVSVFDYMHFVNTDRRFAGRQNEINSNDSMRQYVTSIFVKRVLSVQYGEKLGIKVTKDQVLSYIRDIPFFKKEDGSFSSEALDQYLAHFNMSFDQFYTRTKDVLVLEELNNLVVHGTGSAPGEMLFQKQVASSNIVLEYALLPLSVLKERYSEEIAVSEDEIDARISEEAEDTADRKKTRAALENEKIEVVKQRIVGELNLLTEKGASFADGIYLIDITPKDTKPFKVGDPVYANDKEGSILYDMYSNQHFSDDCLKTEVGKLPRAINAKSGIYIYTPKSVVIPEKVEIAALTEAEKNQHLSTQFAEVHDALLKPFFDSSEVVRKFENQEE